MKLFNKSSKGFTLIELLIVIAILGVLAAALLVALNPAQKIAAANNSRVKQDVTNIGNAANLFATETALRGCIGSYPWQWNAGGVTCSGTQPTFKAVAPRDPRNVVYTPVYDGACDGNATPCTRYAVWGTAYADATASPAVAAGSIWCWRSTTGQVTNLATGGCTLP